MKTLHRIERTAAIWLFGSAMIAFTCACLVLGSLRAGVLLTYKTWNE